MLLCIIYVFILYVSLLLFINYPYKLIYLPPIVLHNNSVCKKRLYFAKKDYFLLLFNQQNNTKKQILDFNHIQYLFIYYLYIYIDRFYHNIIAKKNSPLSHLMTCLALYLSSTAITLRSPKPCSCFSSFLVIIYPSSVICGSYL